MPRNFKDIMTKIKGVSPISTQGFDMHKRIDKLIDSDYYRAPESKRLSWDEAHDMLMNITYPPLEDWEYKVWAIFTDNTEETIHKHLK